MGPELGVPLTGRIAAPSMLRFAETQRDRVLRRVARGCASATVVLALGALAGFAFEIRSLASLNPDFSPMKPNSAFAVLALSYAVFVLVAPARQHSRAGWARLAALFALAIASATLAERVFSWELGIDELVFRDPWPNPGATPGRPAGVSSLAIAMLAIALLLALRGLAYTGAQALAIAAACIGGLALIGYVFGARALYAFKSYSQVGPSSAFSLLLLSIGTLAGMPDRGITGLALANSIGGALTRRLVPVAFGAPLLLASLAQLASQRGIVRPELAMALFVVATIAVLGAVILRTAHSIHRLDEIRSRSEALLRESSSRVRHLAAIVAAAESAIVSFDSLGRVVTWNPRAEQLLGRRATDAIGRHASEVFALDRERKLPGLLEEVVRSAEVRRLELDFQTPRGRRVEGVLTLSPLVDRERHTVGACAVLEENRDTSAERARADREA